MYHVCNFFNLLAQLKKVVVGASDEKRGFRKMAGNVLHPKTIYTEGV